ncbi:hypothetical protein RRG08_019261 [Elysia crispata]|uniref:Uncharacterized protein n=1 Tax=Elysia crispata TaxID=231223 RepID=A0AAE0YT21_9GAST|nr:hypothetical protein RRG08_019261 [Elysia crispata]
MARMTAQSVVHEKRRLLARFDTRTTAINWFWFGDGNRWEYLELASTGQSISVKKTIHRDYTRRKGCLPVQRPGCKLQASISPTLSVTEFRSTVQPHA